MLLIAGDKLEAGERKRVQSGGLLEGRKWRGRRGLP
jgi:hypothetical protein